VEYRDEPSGTDNQTMVSVEWPLDLFRRTGRVEVADREIAVANSSVADRERQLAADVRARYGEALVAIRDLSVLEEVIATARRQADLLRARAEQGSIPPLERDLLEVDVRRLDAERLLLLGRAEASMVELKRAIGLRPAEPLRLRQPLETLIGREAPTTTTRPAGGDVTERPDIRQAMGRMGLADARADEARRDARFDVSLVGGFTRMDAGFPQLGVSPNGGLERVRGVFNYLSIGAMVSVPLFNRNQGQIAMAAAEHAAASASLDAARLSADSEVAAARVRGERAWQAVQLYQGGVRTLARQNLTVVQQSYELGRGTVYEVMAEQRRYLEIERAYTTVLGAAYEAGAALKRALGETR
jgi:cobalt-zinc-cadmium efflux system outer membrane protein